MVFTPGHFFLIFLQFSVFQESQAPPSKELYEPRTGWGYESTKGFVLGQPVKFRDVDIGIISVEGKYLSCCSSFHHQTYKLRPSSMKQDLPR